MTPEIGGRGWNRLDRIQQLRDEIASANLAAAEIMRNIDAPIEGICGMVSVKPRNSDKWNSGLLRCDKRHHHVVWIVPGEIQSAVHGLVRAHLEAKASPWRDRVRALRAELAYEEAGANR